jgi:iron complex transport system ATP-binding protein
VGGRPLAELPPRERAQLIGVVPQSLESLPEVTVESFVLGGRYTRISRWHGALARDHRAVGYALAASDAEGLGARRLQELSGGQRQRVLVARALAQEAQILLVDEPTAALDLEHQVRVFDLLARLAANDRSVLVVTHDVNLASQFASRVVLLDAGRVVARGAPADVLRREVLEPVYGRHLHFGRMPPPDGRPFVLPWMSPEAASGDGAGNSPAPREPGSGGA